MSSLELTLLYLCAAVVSVVGCRLLHLPAMLGYLLAGLVLGPNALSLAKDSAATFWKFAEALSAGAWKRKNVDQQDYESTLAFAAAHLSPNDGAALRFALSMRYYSVRVEKSRQQWKAEVPSTAFCNTVLQHDAAEHLATHCDTSNLKQKRHPYSSTQIMQPWISKELQQNYLHLIT
jgi:hypothetical protein